MMTGSVLSKEKMGKSMKDGKGCCFLTREPYRLFLTGSYDGMTRLWNSSGECVTTFQGHSNAVKSVAFAQGKFKIHYPV